MCMDIFKDIKKNTSLKDKNKDESTSPSDSTYEKSVKIGESIGDVITSKWNSQKEPGKVYVKNRRVHHGEVGTTMGISEAFKDSDPTITGIISGIGKGLIKDDIADKEKWFTFKKKEEEEESGEKQQ
jgi:F0F1-type ATP synthase assembly protein I